MKDVEDAIVKYSSIVDQIHFTELDIRANMEMGGQLQFDRGEGNKIDEKVVKKQQEQYSNLFRVLRKHKDVVTNVTFWNLSDRDSWLGVNNYALPFDKEYKPKQVYYMIRDFDPKQDKAAWKAEAEKK